MSAILICALATVTAIRVDGQPADLTPQCRSDSGQTTNDPASVNQSWSTLQRDYDLLLHARDFRNDDGTVNAARFVAAERLARTYRECGLQFFERFSSDSRRWTWLVQTTLHPPAYWRDVDEARQLLDRRVPASLVPVGLNRLQRSYIDAQDRTPSWLVPRDTNALHVWAHTRTVLQPALDTASDVSAFERSMLRYHALATRGEEIGRALAAGRSVPIDPYLDSIRVHSAIAPYYGVTALIRQVMASMRQQDRELPNYVPFGVSDSTLTAFLTRIIQTSDSVAANFSRSQLALVRINSTPLQMHWADESGRQFDLSTKRGRVVVVDYMSVTCAPCMASLPTLMSLYSTYHSRGLDLISISLDDSTLQREVHSTFSILPWSTVYTGCPSWDADSVVARFGIPTVPFMFVIDRHGQVVYNGGDNEYMLRLLIPDLIRGSR